jgi:uncharacterized protein (DUF433 family)
MASAESVIVKDPQILGGEPVFRNTRVPFQALIDYLEGGQSLDEFLLDFPTVTPVTPLLPRWKKRNLWAFKKSL